MILMADLIVFGSCTMSPDSHICLVWLFHHACVLCMKTFSKDQPVTYRAVYATRVCLFGTMLWSEAVVDILYNLSAQWLAMVLPISCLRITYKAAFFMDSAAWANISCFIPTRWLTVDHSSLNELLLSMKLT